MIRSSAISLLVFVAGHFFLQRTAMAQAENTYLCNGYRVALPFSDEFNVYHLNYEEGYYLIFSRHIDSVSNEDTSYIAFHCGSMVVLPHLRDAGYVASDSSAYERSGVKEDGRFWRELNLPGNMNMYYNHASHDDKRLYDGMIQRVLQDSSLKIPTGPTATILSTILSINYWTSYRTGRARCL